MHLDLTPTREPGDAAEELVQRMAKLPCAQRQPLVYPLIALVQDWPVEKLQALLTRLAGLCRTNGHLPAQANALMSWRGQSFAKKRRALRIAYPPSSQFGHAHLGKHAG
jgi:hypothetical protein